MDKLILNHRQEKLLEFVTKKHGDQKRKYTGEPYVNHLMNVATIVSKYETYCIEAAICHDLYEDTNCTFSELYAYMRLIGYDELVSYKTCTIVQALTDKFTKEYYPHLNRAKRKKLESNRLSKQDYNSQSIKYADLIDNTSSIVENDPEFAETYLNEAREMLSIMRKGNKDLLEICERVVEEGSKKILSKLNSSL